MTPLCRDDIIQIATAQKRLLYAFLFGVLATVVQVLLFVEAAGISMENSTAQNSGWTGVVFLLTVIPQLAACGRFCHAMRLGRGSTQLLIVTQVIPCVSLIVLILEHIAAGRRLRLNGIRSGWLGINSTQLAALGTNNVICPACGEAAFSSSLRCPMCGKELTSL